jgi:hypothetical protein
MENTWQPWRLNYVELTRIRTIRVNYKLTYKLQVKYVHESHYNYKMLTWLMRRDIDGMKVYLKRLVNAIGSSYVRHLCLRLYLA